MCQILLTYVRTALLAFCIVSLSPSVAGQEKENKEEKEKAEKIKPESDTLEYYYLLSGPDIQGNLNYGLMTAALEGNVDGIGWLIKNGAEVNAPTAENLTPLMFAVAANRPEAVKVLLENNADPDIVSIYSETPLLVAVKNQNLEIAELLLRDSADINLSDRYGATPLHYAAAYGFFYIVDLLIYYEAAVFSITYDGTTPLMAAIWSGHADIADLLMQNGANPSEKDNEGFSPFLIAAQNGDTVIMNLLLKRWVNIYDVNIYNYNALDLCIKGNHKAAVEYLLKKGDKWTSAEGDLVSPYSVATVYRRKELTGILKENNIPETEKPGIDQISVFASLKHCYYDFQAGFSVMAKEPVKNFGFLAGIDFKPYYTRVMVKENEELFYQYRDRSTLVYAGVFKDFPITDHPLRGNWSFTGSLSAAYGFGNKLRGTSVTPGNKMRINPAAGFKWTSNSFGIIMSIEYLDTDFYRVGPVWFRMGASYNFYLNNVRAPGKIIKWY